jgi:predicted RNA-binding protein with RPS1 domain
MVDDVLVGGGEVELRVEAVDEEERVSPASLRSERQGGEEKRLGRKRGEPSTHATNFKHLRTRNVDSHLNLCNLSSFSASAQSSIPLKLLRSLINQV